MDIEIFYRDVYGKTLAYPANDAASALCLLTRTRTLDERALTLARALGHVVLIVPGPIKKG